MDFKERMKGKRNKIGMTLEDVAKVVGVSRQTIQKYESGIVANIPSDKIELLAKALHTSPAYGLIAIWLTEKHKKRRGQTAPLSLYMY
jgi:repressor LexA